MSRLRLRRLGLLSISPVFPFYVLGQPPGQVLWPVLFSPLILIANFVWALVLATGMVLALGKTERVGQRILVRYALWATIAGVIISFGHDVTLTWLGQRVDFLLESQPWRLIAGTYVVPCILLLVYHWLLSWQYLRLQAWQAAIMGAAFALLTAPWTTLLVIDDGQGRLPASARGTLVFSLILLAVAIFLLAAATTIGRRMANMRRLGGAALLVSLAGLLAVGGGSLWWTAVRAPAVSTLAISGISGDLAFAVRNRVYAAAAGATQARALGPADGQVVAWSPDQRLLLLNEQQASNQTVVTVKPADREGSGKVLGTGVAGQGAWSPDSSTIVYVTLTDTSGQIHVASANGSSDRIIAEGRSPSWSPDGRRIIYSARTAGRWQVWIMLPSGADAIQLTTDGGEDPAWSPDGRYIAYVQNNRVHVMDADGSNKRRLIVDNTFTDTRPVLSWSADGSRLAYIYIYPPESGRPSQLNIWETTMAAIPLGGTLLPLTTPTPQTSRGLSRSGEFRAPFAWSPDGAWLGFIRRGDLWMINVRTGEERRLIPADSFAWGGSSLGLVVRSVPTYPPTPTPTPLPASAIESPYVLVLDPKDATTILAGIGSGLARKTGSGGWALMNSGIGYPLRVHTIAFDPTDPTTVYAGTDGQRAVAGALYKSIDRGTRWMATGLKDADVYRVVVDPRQPANLFAGTNNGFLTSNDGGVTWTAHNGGLKSTAVTALTLDTAASLPAARAAASPAAASTVLYLGLRQGELYKSTNGGNDWKLLQTINSPVTSLVVHPSRPVVFATSEDGLFTSSDGGETWNQVSGGIWKMRLDGLVVSAKPDQIFTYGPTGVFISHDGGANWGPASQGLEGTQPSALVCHPTDPAIVYVGTDKGIFRSGNGGITWSR